MLQDRCKLYRCAMAGEVQELCVGCMRACVCVRVCVSSFYIFMAKCFSGCFAVRRRYSHVSRRDWCVRYTSFCHYIAVWVTWNYERFAPQYTALLSRLLAKCNGVYKWILTNNPSLLVYCTRMVWNLDLLYIFSDHSAINWEENRSSWEYTSRK